MPSVQLKGVKIAYEEVGEGAPLLLIMGLGAPGAAWEKHLAAYSRNFRCITMDNRGSGDSDKPTGDYTTAMMADDAAGLLDELGISSASVAGISMGSGIAQELALRHPDKVKCLVLVSSWARCDSYMRETFLHFQTTRRDLSAPNFTRLLQLWIYAPEYFGSNYSELEDAKNSNGPVMAFHAFAAQTEACINHNTLDRLCDIVQPCLLTVGDTDIFTPLRFSQEMASRLPNAELRVFQNAGHCHHWENLCEFNEMTVRFLLSNQDHK
jgi:pimeloyl-ACP methyl ester carboxylesterase